MVKIAFNSITAQITCADCSGLMNAFIANNVRIYDVQYIDCLTLCLRIGRKDAKLAQHITVNNGGTFRKIQMSGVCVHLERLIKRPLLLIFLSMMLFLSCYLPSRVLFITVEGNQTIPAGYILEVAADCGIEFGSSRRQVRSEIMKNRLLEKIPQLQWAGINTSGCTAVISVREKTPLDNSKQNTSPVTSIVAARDGVIQSCTVLKGTPLCKVGQAVKAGQTLVSGYVDCGSVTKTTQAAAEIQALTFRELELMAPSPSLTRGSSIRTVTQFSLRIGKKLIKFYKDSGNLDSTCVKIYSEEYMRLPGGFQLPVAIIKETTEYFSQGDAPAVTDHSGWLSDYARKYLSNLLISGAVISEQTTVSPIEGACYYYGRFACVESIGQIKYEQTLPKDG